MKVGRKEKRKRRQGRSGGKNERTEGREDEGRQRVKKGGREGGEEEKSQCDFTMQANQLLQADLFSASSNLNSFNYGLKIYLSAQADTSSSTPFLTACLSAFPPDSAL